MIESLNKITSSNTRGVQLFLLMTLIGSAFALINYELNLETWLLIILGYFLYGCLGIVVTFHRNLTHNSYKTYNFLSKFFSVLGCFGGTGSPIAWVAIHVNHHLKSDKPGDPHSPMYKGIKIFNLDYGNEIDSGTKWRIRHLITDKFQQILHKYYFVILLSYSLLLFIIGGIYLMVFLHWLPALITAIMSNVVNYVGHKPKWFGGYRTHHINDQSTNNWIWAIPSWGESWHNNHHRFPKRSYFGERWWELDISGLIIRAIQKV